MPSFARPRPAGSLRWLLLLGLGLLAAVGDGRLPAQAPKGKAPPAKEEEDPKAKPVKPPPRIDEDAPPKPDTTPAEGPGMAPPAGVLVVGVRSLPELMSPSLARTDSEKFALDLLFEGLLRPATDAAAGGYFEPALARELPTIVPRGRDFTLADNATWADPDAAEPQRVTYADVRSTLAKLHARAGKPGAEAGELIEAVYSDAPQRCRVVLRRGHIDPLSLMTFKILPNNRPDDEAFARHPVGSGPFVYDGRQPKGGREYAVFKANPAYGRRPGRTNLPRLGEVWMVVSRSPVADLSGGLVHFVLTNRTGDLSTAKAAPKPDADAPRQGRLEVNLGTGGKVETRPSRRIYFLAVNHAVPALGGAGGTDLRRLLAHAIQRDAILNECFRAGYRDFHQALNGPFPPDTWPCSPLVSPTLDQPDLARSLIDPRRKPVALELKYPADDPAVERACQMMQKQLEELKAGVTLKLKAEPPAELRRRVESENDFQLAYWHYDYPDDWFSPAGLLDPKATGLGNRNFMGYVPPPDFDAVLARCQNRRDFAEVRKAMQRLHDVFVKEMPFIPLWHLDTHLLIHAGLETVPPAGQLDPLAPFTHIERWTLK